MHTLAKLNINLLYNYVTLLEKGMIRTLWQT